MPVYMPRFVLLRRLSTRAGLGNSLSKPVRTARIGAFTLIELLVVLAIIAVLASLVLPALSRAKGQSNRALCANNFRQIGIATRLYADDNSDYLPMQNSGYYDSFGPGWLYNASTNSSVNTNVLFTSEGAMTGQIWPYLKNTNSYWCPLDRAPAAGLVRYMNNSDNGEPGDITARPQQCSSYVITVMINGTGGYVSQKWSDFRSDGFCYWESDENGGWSSWNAGCGFPDGFETHHHNEGGNILSFDSHVEWMSWANFNLIGTQFPGRGWCNPQLPNGSKWPNWPAM